LLSYTGVRRTLNPPLKSPLAVSKELK